MKTKEKLQDRCKRVGLSMGWTHPFLLMPLAYVTFKEEPSVPTAGVGVTGTIYMNPGFVEGLSDRQLLFVIAHELFHLIMMHAHRLGGRNTAKWNRAADRAINQLIKEMGAGEPVPGALFPPSGKETWPAEDLYGVEPDQKDDDSSGQGPAGAGCGVKDDSGQGGQPGQDPNAPGGQGAAQSLGDLTRQWQEVAAQAENMAKGTGAGNILVRGLTPPPTRVDWKRVIKNGIAQAMAAHGRDDQTYTKRNRRQPPGIILPGWHAVRATVACIIDASGSVSDTSLATFLSHILKIQKLNPTADIFLVIHDDGVYFADWLKVQHPDKVPIQGRGGTTFRPAYKAVAAAGKRFDVMVHFTDGAPCEKWPAKPSNVRHAIVGLTGDFATEIPTDFRTVLVDPMGAE